MKTDTRKLSIAELNEKRRTAVRLRMSGAALAEVKAATGLSAPTIIASHKAFLAGGWEGVAVGSRGRSHGDGRLISAEQEADVFKLMIANTPDQLSLPHPLWQTSAMQALVHKRFGIELPDRSIANYLQQIGRAHV